jgi:hypothetical protein
LVRVINVKAKYKILAIMHFFVGAGALFGGGAAILNPLSPLGVPLDLLINSPFENFLVPGLILFLIIGIGSMISGFMAVLKSNYQGYFSSVSSWALMIWIVVQCFMIRAVAFPHVLFFFIGLAGAVLAFSILDAKQQFPANHLCKYVKQ